MIILNFSHNLIFEKIIGRGLISWKMYRSLLLAKQISDRFLL